MDRREMTTGEAEAYEAGYRAAMDARASGPSSGRLEPMVNGVAVGCMPFAVFLGLPMIIFALHGWHWPDGASLPLAVGSLVIGLVMGLGAWAAKSIE